MLKEGYAAVTSRRVATTAGVNSALVHYYFPTMDDLFLAVLQRGAEVNLGRQQQALVSQQPLRELWELALGPFGTALMIEFSALANHRKAIRDVIAGYTERFHEIQQTALTFILRERGIDPADRSPVLLSMMLSSLAATMVNARNHPGTSGADHIRRRTRPSPRSACPITSGDGRGHVPHGVPESPCPAAVSSRDSVSSIRSGWNTSAGHASTGPASWFSRRYTMAGWSMSLARTYSTR